MTKIHLLLIMCSFLTAVAYTNVETLDDESITNSIALSTVVSESVLPTSSAFKRVLRPLEKANPSLIKLLLFLKHRLSRKTTTFKSNQKKPLYSSRSFSLQPVSIRKFFSSFTSAVKNTLLSTTNFQRNKYAKNKNNKID